MLLIEMKEITPELIAKALKEESLDANVDEDNDVIIRSEQLMIGKIYKDKGMVKFFGSIPIETDKSSRNDKEKFIGRMNRTSNLMKYSLFENGDNSSFFFETCIPLTGWVSSDFLSGAYFKAVSEVKNIQSYIPYISELAKEE